MVELFRWSGEYGDDDEFGWCGDRCGDCGLTFGWYGLELYSGKREFLEFIKRFPKAELGGNANG